VRTTALGKILTLDNLRKRGVIVVGTRSILAVWKITLLCLMWSIWRERNARCFKDHKKSKDKHKNILVKSLFNWIGAFNISSFSNFYLFVEFCSSFCL
jgi:hypothetical protein